MIKHYEFNNMHFSLINLLDRQVIQPSFPTLTQNYAISIKNIDIKDILEINIDAKNLFVNFT